MGLARERDDSIDKRRLWPLVESLLAAIGVEALVVTTIGVETLVVVAVIVVGVEALVLSVATAVGDAG